jgi:hypothetical protein
MPVANPGITQSAGLPAAWVPPLCLGLKSRFRETVKASTGAEALTESVQSLHVQLGLPHLQPRSWVQAESPHEHPVDLH